MYFEKASRKERPNGRKGNYMRLLSEFCEANIDFAEVKNYVASKPSIVTFGINRAASRGRFPVHAFNEMEHVYIERTDGRGDE